MSLTNRIKSALRALTNPEVIVQQKDHSYVQTLENIKIATLPPSLQQYANFIVTPPPFFTYWGYYQSFAEIQTPINRIAKRIAGLNGRLYTFDGYIEDKKTEELHQDYGIIDLIEEFIIDLLVYGQAVIALFNDGERQIFKIIPAHEIIVWNTNFFDITKVVWKLEHMTLTIDSNFYISRLPSINSKFFGKSPLSSLYDDLNQLDLDRENFNRFLKNNSFFGVAVLPKDGITKEEFESLQNAVRELNNPQSRYKAGVYAHVQDIQIIKQEIQARLTTDEKEYIAVKAANSIGYPYQFLKKSTTGIGQGEQKSILQIYKDETIQPLQQKVESFVNEYILQSIPNKNQYKNLIWKANEMHTTTREEMAEIANKLFTSGLISSYEAKTRFIGYTDDEVQVDDKFRIINNTILKEGELKDTKIDQETIQDKINNAKSLNGNDKQRIKKYIQRIKEERKAGFSPVPIVIENDRAKMLEDTLKQAFIDQFKDFDYILNKKTLEITDSLTEDQISQEIKSLAEYLDVPFVTYLISYLATLGKLDAIEQLKELDIELTDQQRAEITSKIQEYSKRRVGSLLGLENGQSDSIDNPLIENSLDDTTAKILFSILQLATTKKEIEEIYLKRIEERIKLIKETEAARTYNAALFIVAKIIPNIGWEWLRTRSKEPREIHLALVGRTARFGELIDGEYPGVRVNCKCGVKFIKLYD